MKPRLQELRVAAGYKSAREFAEKCGMSVRTYTNYEQGTTCLTLEKAWKFADILRCSLDELAGRTPPPTNPQQSASESELLQHFAQCNKARREAVLTVLADCALASMMDTCKAAA